MSFPHGKDLGSAILFWSCATIVWGNLAAIVLWVAMARVWPLWWRGW
jgi:hypothetical protein